MANVLRQFPSTLHGTLPAWFFKRYGLGENAPLIADDFFEATGEPPPAINSGAFSADGVAVYQSVGAALATASASIVSTTDAQSVGAAVASAEFSALLSSGFDVAGGSVIVVAASLDSAAQAALQIGGSAIADGEMTSSSATALEWVGASEASCDISCSVAAFWQALGAATSEGAAQAQGDALMQGHGSAIAASEAEMAGVWIFAVEGGAVQVAAFSSAAASKLEALGATLAGDNVVSAEWLASLDSRADWIGGLASQPNTYIGADPRVFSRLGMRAMRPQPKKSKPKPNRGADGMRLHPEDDYADRA